MVPAVLLQRGIARTLELVGLQVPLPRPRSTAKGGEGEVALRPPTVF